MPSLHAGLAPEPVPEATRLAAVAAHHRAELDAFLAEIEGGVRALMPADRCLVWRSAAAEAYEGRLHELGVRLSVVVTVVADACESQRRQVGHLEMIAGAPGTG